jgi:DNA-binding NarL/FixJ family response regulator
MSLSTPIRVLIVDDHPTLLWGLERLLASQAPEMQVLAVASSLQECLSLAQLHSPDLVLLDLALGELSGLDAIGPLTVGGARVLVLTGERSQEPLDRAVQLGARGVLRKDAAADTVLKAVRKVHAGEFWLDRLTLGRVLEGLRTPPPSARAHPEAQKQATLTQRERAIIEAILDGRGASNKALAARLFISEHTLRNHLSSIYHKLDLGNRMELYVYALKHQLGRQTPALDGLRS